MITALLLTGDGCWRPLAVQFRVLVLPGLPSLPRDVFAVVVDALASALVAEYRARQGGRR